MVGLPFWGNDQNRPTLLPSSQTELPTFPSFLPDRLEVTLFMESGCHGIVWEQEHRLAILASGKTEEWEEMELLSLALGGRAFMGAGGGGGHRPCTVARLMLL